MKPLVPFAALQAALNGFSCWLFADGAFSTYGEWSGVGAAFFACGWLLWTLAALALWTDCSPSQVST
jgi:hypothetical protein